jgi:hypothetical protein
MTSQRDANLVCDTPGPGIRVARFIRPDLRRVLYDQEAIADCSLFREFDAAALANLAPNDTLILNMGLIDWFPTTFYRFLLKVREMVQARGARLLLCCFTANVWESFDVMGGSKLFDIRTTETAALADAGKR